MFFKVGRMRFFIFGLGLGLLVVAIVSLVNCTEDGTQYQAFDVATNKPLTPKCKSVFMEQCGYRFYKCLDGKYYSCLHDLTITRTEE